MGNAIIPASKVSPRRGAGLLLEILESEGVEYIFGNPGTTELPLIDALPKILAGDSFRAATLSTSFKMSSEFMVFDRFEV